MDIKAVPSRPIHSPSTMARGATRKAVLALEVRSHELHVHAPRPRRQGVSPVFIFSTLHNNGRGKEVEAWVERLVCRSRDSFPCLVTRGATVERIEGDPWAADLAIEKCDLSQKH